MADVNVKINGKEYTVPAGSTILEAARIAGINIPTLCYLKEINAICAKLLKFAVAASYA